MTEITRIGPVEAWESIQRDPRSLLLDVRDPLEFAFVGHPVGAVNIPWKTAPDWAPNTHFLDDVRCVAVEFDRPILVMCRSGQRSMDAARALLAAGYRNLANIDEGFEGPLDPAKHRGTVGGWRFRGLPWEQS
ncbi:MAG: rhodanese-like domain-containing protein [Methylotetracoccus sp.]